jgi:hypothetical protein
MAAKPKAETPEATSWDPTTQDEHQESPGLVKEFLRFLWENKLWWMTPTIVILLLLGFVIFRAKESAVAPFIYALF